MVYKLYLSIYLSMVNSDKQERSRIVQFPSITDDIIDGSPD